MEHIILAAGLLLRDVTQADLVQAGGTDPGMPVWVSTTPFDLSQVLMAIWGDATNLASGSGQVFLPVAQYYLVVLTFMYSLVILQGTLHMTVHQRTRMRMRSEWLFWRVFQWTLNTRSGLRM
jgi:hypothetical protein